MKVFVNGNTIEIHMTRAEAADCSHSGSCDRDCEEMVKRHPRLFARMPRDVLIANFFGYGTWSAKELREKTDHELHVLACWIAAGDIADNPECKGWTSIDGSYGMAHPEYIQDR